AVPTKVVVAAVAVLLAIRLVVFPVVHHQVIECESIVARDEIDALLGLALLVTVDLRAADQSVSKPPQRPPVAPKEAAGVVAEAAVPLLQTDRDKGADLEESSRIQRLGDELRACEKWI